MSKETLIKTYISLKCSKPDHSYRHYLKEMITMFYYKACSGGSLADIDLILRHKIVTDDINRFNILRGITILFHVKDINYFRLVIKLVDHFGIKKEEVSGEQYNLLNYSLSCDNVDVTHYLMKKYRINLCLLDPLQKDLLIDTIIYNISRRCLKYLFQNNQINKADINKIPPEFITNQKFKEELMVKYGYLEIKIQKVDKMPSKLYRPPHQRSYKPMYPSNNHPLKNSRFKMFKHKTTNRSDRDLNWRS